MPPNQLGKCVHCSQNITKTLRTGLGCIKCKKNFHRTCANVPSHIDIWTCKACEDKRKSSANVTRRSSNTLLRPSIGSSASSSQSVTQGGLGETIMNEITNLKSSNVKIMQTLVALTEELTLLREFRAENMILREANKRLVSENTELLKAVRISEQRSVINNEPGTSRSSLSEQRPQSIDSRLSLGSGSQMDPLLSSQESEGNHKDLRAADNFKWIYVTNLQPQTTCEDVKSHIVLKTNINRSLLSSQKVTPKSIIQPIFSTFKVGVPQAIFNEVVRNEFWPSNCRAREFVDRKNFRFSDQILRKD